MKNTLRLGEAIYKILKDFENVYPLVAKESTTFPFIIYRRSSGYTQNSKDGIYSVVSNIDILVAATNYDDSIELAEKVLRKMESSKGIYSDFDIWNIKMINCNESFIENTFIQEMTFAVEFSLTNKVGKICY